MFRHRCLCCKQAVMLVAGTETAWQGWHALSLTHRTPHRKAGAWAYAMTTWGAIKCTCHVHTRQQQMGRDTNIQVKDIIYNNVGFRGRTCPRPLILHPTRVTETKLWRS